MTIIDGKITACTDLELIDYWLSRGWDDIYTYPDFKARMELLGVIVMEPIEELQNNLIGGTK